MNKYLFNAFSSFNWFVAWFQSFSSISICSLNWLFPDWHICSGRLKKKKTASSWSAAKAIDGGGCWGATSSKRFPFALNSVGSPVSRRWWRQNNLWYSSPAAEVSVVQTETSSVSSWSCFHQMVPSGPLCKKNNKKNREKCMLKKTNRMKMMMFSQVGARYDAAVLHSCHTCTFDFIHWWPFIWFWPGWFYCK